MGSYVPAGFFGLAGRWGAVAMLMGALACPHIALGKENALWEKYKKTFITADGRVIDYQQGESSHSEGQGYSMLIAIDYGDKPAFDAIWAWTQKNLAVRADGLLAWLWGKRVNGAWGVIDYNNATDGDLLVALALLKAGAKWNDQTLTKNGLALAQAIREHLLVSWAGRTYLLPGHFGFAFDGGFTLNPSYQVLPAFRLFAGADKAPDIQFSAHDNALLDADRTLSAIYHSGGSQSAYKNEEFDKLVYEARTETDVAKREEMYHKAIQIAYDEAAIVPLLNLANVYGLSERLQWKPRRDGKILAYEMSLAE